jgi:hypothetical protein
LAGAKVKIVSGFPGQAAAFLALDRGEVHGNAGATIGTLMALRPQWLKEPGLANFVVQLATEAHPTLLKGVPVIMDFAKDDTDRQALESRASTASRSWRARISASTSAYLASSASARAAAFATSAAPTESGGSPAAACAKAPDVDIAPEISIRIAAVVLYMAITFALTLVSSNRSRRS